MCHCQHLVSCLQPSPVRALTVLWTKLIHYWRSSFALSTSPNASPVHDLMLYSQTFRSIPRALFLALYRQFPFFQTVSWFPYTIWPAPVVPNWPIISQIWDATQQTRNRHILRGSIKNRSRSKNLIQVVLGPPRPSSQFSNFQAPLLCVYLRTLCCCVSVL